MIHSIRFASRAFVVGARHRFAISLALMFLASCWMAHSAIAQPVAWPIASLQPAGADDPVVPLADAAIAGDTAFTAYGPTADAGYSVFVRQFVAGEWQPAQLVVRGTIGEGSPWVVADGDTLAVGLPESSSMQGRVDIYRRSGPSSWVLEQQLTSLATAPWPRFGSKLSFRSSLLTVSSRFGWGVRIETFRRNVETGQWQDAGLVQSSASELTAHTDGSRVAICSVGGCSSRQLDGQGQWQANPLPNSQVHTAVVDGEWMFASTYAGAGMWYLGAYRFDGIGWQLQQSLGASVSERMITSRGGKLALIRGGKLLTYTLDNADTWMLEAEAALPQGIRQEVEVDAGLALVGPQSFTLAGNQWAAAGVVNEERQRISAGFGMPVLFAGGNLWMGASGHDSDFRAGAVWLQPMSDVLPAHPSTLIIPARLAMGSQFGAFISSDGDRMAIASGTTATDGRTVLRTYDASGSDLIGMGIAVPSDQGPSWTTVDVSIHGDSVVLSRISTGVCELHIFRGGGSGYAWLQTIRMIGPESPCSSGGVNVELSAGWLLAGQRRYERMADGSYAHRGELALPASLDGIAYDFSRLAQGDGRLVVPVLSDPSQTRLAAVFTQDPLQGWIYAGDVLGDNAGETALVCSSMAVSEQAIVCMQSGSDHLHVARAVGATGNWRMIGSASVPGMASGLFSRPSLDVSGNRVAIGSWEAARVVILSLSEAIFASGFEEASGAR